jgi:NAD(P)-dependent dehydrogenase (short-subunit alcohol dehydrogenase family)
MPIPTILITGGASGIGAGIATRLAKDGARIIIADRDQKAALPNTRSVHCDISVEAEVNQLISDIVSTEGALTGIVCNAGFGITRKMIYAE